MPPRTFPYKEIESCHSLCWASLFVWKYLPLFRTSCSAQTCVTWHWTSPTTISVPGGEGMEFFASRTRGLMQIIGDTHSWSCPCPPSSLCEESISSSGCVSRVFRDNPNTCKPWRGLTSWDCWSWWQVWLRCLLCSWLWDSCPGGGNRCHLLNKKHFCACLIC